MLVAAIAALSLTGCLTGCMALSVPRTTVSGKIAGQPFSISSPKDSELNGLAITVTTNGNVSITITSLKATMDPAVIQMTGTAQAQIITAVANGVASSMGTAAGSAAAAGIGGK